MHFASQGCDFRETERQSCGIPIYDFKGKPNGIYKVKKIHAYRLTAAERERITENVCKSTGAKYFFKKYGKNVIIYSALLGAAVILVVLIYNYMHSEKYLKRMYEAAEETVIIESAYKTDYGIKLTIHNNSLAAHLSVSIPSPSSIMPISPLATISN